MSNRSLDREQTVVSNMARGLEVVLEMKKPGLAAAYLHRQLNKVASQEDAALHRQVHEDLKEIMSVNGKNSFPTLPAWDPFASRSSGLPEQNPPAARSGRSVRGRQSLNKNPAGGRTNTKCSKRSSLGLPADHSFRSCPNLECYKCKQRGRS